jgi:hypothetical protein
MKSICQITFLGSIAVLIAAMLGELFPGPRHSPIDFFEMLAVAAVLALLSLFRE